MNDVQLDDLGPLADESAAETDTATEALSAPKSRRRKILIAAVAIPAVVLTTAGAYLLGTQSASTGAAPNPSTSTQEESATPEDAKVDWDNVVAMNEAMDAGDSEAMRALVSPGSPAERWLTHYEISDATDVAAGVPSQPSDAAITYDEGAGTVTRTYPDGDVTVNTEWVTDPDGLIVSWSDAAGVPIGDRLWTQTPSGTGAGQTVTVTSAFRNSSGTLAVNVDITTGPGGEIDWAPTYVGPDGVARQASAYSAPNDLTPGAVTKATYYFDAAEFGGTMTYEAWNSSNYGDAAITLPIA